MAKTRTCLKGEASRRMSEGSPVAITEASKSRAVATTNASTARLRARSRVRPAVTLWTWSARRVRGATLRSSDHQEWRWPRVATASVRASGAGAVLALGRGRFGAEGRERWRLPARGGRWVGSDRKRWAPLTVSDRSGLDRTDQPGGLGRDWVVRASLESGAREPLNDERLHPRTPSVKWSVGKAQQTLASAARSNPS